MATWDVLNIDINKTSQTFKVNRGFSSKEVNGKLSRKVIEQLKKILHNPDRGYDIFYTNSDMPGYPNYSLCYRSKFSLYFKKE